MTNKPTVGSKWIHNRSGREFVVIGNATDVKDQCGVVVFKDSEQKIFTRSLNEWNEELSTGRKRYSEIIDVSTVEKKQRTNVEDFIRESKEKLLERGLLICNRCHEVLSKEDGLECYICELSFCFDCKEFEKNETVDKEHCFDCSDEE